MTRDELKAALTPIVIDEAKSVAERGKLLLPFMAEWMTTNQHRDVNEVMNEWNNIMVEIVDEHNLRRH